MTTFEPRSDGEHLRAIATALTPHKSGRELVRFQQPDEPYFHLSDTCWATFHRLNYREAELLIRNRASKGFTCIMMVILVQHGAFLYPNRAGAWPFSPLPGYEEAHDKYLPDVTKPNPDYFEFIDKVLDLAHSLGITIALLPTWGRYVNGGYYGAPILFDKDNAFVYGRFLGERYPFHPWVLGGDSNRYWHPDTLKQVQSGKSTRDLEVIDYGPVYDAIAQGLIAGEKAAKKKLNESVLEAAKGYQTFITFHPAQPWLPHATEALGSSEWAEADWLALDCCQTGHHDGHVKAGEHNAATSGVQQSATATGNSNKEDGEKANEHVSKSHAQAGAGNLPMWFARSSYIPIRKMYSRVGPNGKPRPVIDLEPHYENTHHWFTYTAPIWKGDDIRNGGWQAVFAGSTGYVYGCNSLIQMHNDESTTHLPIVPPTTAYTNWYLELDLPGTFYASTIRKIMLSLPNFFTRIPDQSFILSDTNDREGEWVGDKLIQGMRGDGWAMVHLPYGGKVDIDLAKALPGQLKWRAWWIDPRSGGRESFDKGDKATGSKTFSSPSSGSIQTDWLLYVETVTRNWA